MPDILDEMGEGYDAVGFDADHCLVKYNLHNFHRLIIRTGLEDMKKNLGYPEEILDFDLSEGSEEI